MTMQSLEKAPMFTNRALTRLIIPLMIEQVLAVTIGMLDTVMVTSVGEAAVSAISIVDSINILLINVFAALATGGAVVASQYIGRRDRESANDAAKQLVYSIFLMSSLIMLLPLFFNRPILQTIFGAIEPDVMRHAEVYFYLSALSFPGLALYSACAALYRAMGNSKVSMFTSLLMNLINFGGNALLIYGFGMGVAGAAIATLASRWVGAIIMMVMIHRPVNPIFLRNLHKPKLQWSMIGKILRIGVPNGLENSMFQVGKLIVQRLITTFGTAALAANAISNSVAGLANTTGSAICLGLVTVVGQCMGAGEPEQAKHYTHKLLKLSYICMLAFNIVLLFFSRQIVGWFDLSQEAADMAIVTMRSFSICCSIIWPLSFVTPYALRAAGDTVFTMVVAMLSMWIFRIGFSYVLAQYLGMGLLGVWLAMYVDWAVRAAAFTIRFESGAWRKKKVI